MKNKESSASKIVLDSYESLFGDQEDTGKEDRVKMIPIAELYEFAGHPFRVLDDEKMQDLVESIRENGILSPVLVRPVGNDIYEMVSGHRRMHAASLLGMESIPAIIREMTDDEAIVKMVDANIQREE